MSQRYRYDKVPGKHIFKRSFKTLAIIPVIAAFVVLIGWLIIMLTTSKPRTVAGPSKITGSVAAVGYPTQLIEQPTFTIKIPKSWHQTSYINNTQQFDITWMDQDPKKDTRWLILYIDKISPNLSINKLLPIKVIGNGLEFGTISDNCTNFATYNINAQMARANYMGIDFICNIADIVDERVGTGTIGSINLTTITGPIAGTHSYFFEYVEHSGEPDYSFFDNALTSFRAK